MIDSMHWMPAHGGGDELAGLLQQPLALVGALAIDDAQHEEVHQRDRHAYRREQDVVAEHQRRIEPGGDQPDRADGQVARQHRRHPVVARDPVADLAGVPLHEELDGQPQHVPQEPAGGGNRQLRRRTHQEVLLQRRQGRAQQRGDPHAHQQRTKPAVGAADENLVDEDLCERRDGETGDHQPQAGQHAERDRQPHASDPSRQRRDHAGLASALLELRARFEREHHARQPLVELLGGDGAASVGRIVEEHLARGESLQHQEMIELPEDDARRLDPVETLKLDLVARTGQPVPLPGRQHVGGGAAVARHAAVNAKLLQRHPLPEVSQDNAEARRTALHRLHLEERRGPNISSGWQLREV